MIDPDTIPLSRFTGHLCYRVKLRAAGPSEYAAWRKWLHAYLTTSGPGIAVDDHPEAIGWGISLKYQPPRERRMLLAWLVGQTAVESVDVTPRFGLRRSANRDVRHGRTVAEGEHAVSGGSGMASSARALEV